MQKGKQIEATEHWFAGLLAQLADCQQRRLLSCQGSWAWCLQISQIIRSQSDDLIFFSNQTQLSNVIPFSKSETLLGQEARVVVVDLYQGLNADVLCIAAGLVEAGGLLVLLSPEPKHWQLINDEYAIWQNQLASPKLHFIDYVFEKIRFDSSACIELQEDRELPALLPLPQASITSLSNGKTNDQARVLEGIDTLLQHPQQSIALVTANRGRGKSTCLGFIVRNLVENKGLSVYVTAYSRQSATMLLAQFESARFVAPDRLIETQETADVLVIDEAAMLPYAMLDQLCRQFKRVVMATTTGGYEGTGQGFLIRFIAGLPEHALCRLQLHQPVRWGENDCLENWLDETFVLNPSLEAVETQLSNCRYRVLRGNQSEHDLNRIYRLMVSAHYRTRPSDLRALMENPDLIPIVAECANDLPGVALINREGGFDGDLCQQVFLGQRRPKGHLLAQMLTAQAGIADFATYNGLRIQRIAVVESQRRLGIGSGLIKAVDAYAADQNLDYVGASFAFDSESASFWQRCGFHLVHLGYGQGKSSGNHSVAVIKVFNPALVGKVAQLQEKLLNSLPLWLCQFLQNMDAGSVVSLLRFSGFSASLTAIEKNEIRAFSDGHKGFELCFVSLQRAVMTAIAQTAGDQLINPWVIEKLVQNRGWHYLSMDPECQGRKSIQNKLRRLVSELLELENSGS